MATCTKAIIGSSRKIPTFQTIQVQLLCSSSSFTHSDNRRHNHNAFYPLLVLLLLLHITSNLFANLAVSADTSLLQGSDFKIDARVSVSPPPGAATDDQAPKYEYRVREFYSNLQRKARIQMKASQTAAFPRGLQYFYGGINKLLRVTGFTSMKEKPAECSNVKRDQLISDLFGSDLWTKVEGLKEADWFELGQRDVPEYLVGISRILFLIEANKQKLVLQQSKDVVRVRGRPTVGYDLSCLLVPGGQSDACIKLSAFYLAKKPNQVVEEKLPLLIQVTLPKGTVITIHYFLINPVDLPLDQFSPKLSNVINRFTFPLGAGCSSSLLVADLLGEWPAPKVMSFEVKLTDFVANSVRNMFVAYDGYADASRIDLVQESMRPGQSAPYSITVDDMRRNRKYNIIQMLGGSTLQCVAARQFGRTTRRDPYATLIPFNQMIEMGEAKVRGVRSVVFETTTNNLPALLFPRVNYIDSKGLDQSSDLPVINLEKIDEDKDKNKRYSVIYFFAAETAGPPEGNLPGPRLGGYGRLGPLLRVDVLQVDNSANNLQQASSSNQAPKGPAIKGLYRAEIHNFMWQLGDALNGDRADELFSIHDKCSSSDNTANSFGSLSIDMAYDAVNQKSAYSAARAVEMIDSPLMRNKGLIRALSDGLLLSASQIYDLESRIYQSSNEKFLLRATGRISYLRKELFTAKSFGLGYVRSMPPVLLIDNFSDCFWEAARRRQQQGPVLFTFCFSLCHIENQPVLDESTGKIIDSEVFKIDPSLNDNDLDFCEILQIDKEPDDAAQITRPLWASIYKSMNERVLRIPLVEQRRVNDLAFKVQRVEINNDKWSATSGDDHIVSARQETDAELLTGLGLSDKWATRVEQPGNGGQMNYALCHSICVNKMSCRSFSLCSNGIDQPECLISELEFRNSTLLDKLDELKRAKLKEMKGVTTKGSIEISAVDSLEDGDDQVAGSDGLEQQYELRIDRRCRIYNKHALEMFKVPTIEQAAVWKEKSSLIGVDNEEECAQICLNRNVKFFKRSARSRFQVEREKDTYTGAEIEYAAKMMLHQNENLRSWCSSFSYINLLTSSVPDELKSPSNKSDYLTKSGLCVLTRFRFLPKKDGAKEASAEVPIANQSAIRLKVHKYEIIYSLFYERQHGSKLRPLWNYRMSPKGELDDVGHDKVHEMIREGNNQVAIETNNVDSCARACFLQTVGLDPWCKSFGFVSLASTQKATAKTEITTTTRSYCIFNSISMADARKSPLADRLIIEVPDTDSFVHYEPRNSYTLEDVVQTKLMLDKAIDNIIGHNKTGVFKFHSLGIALLFVVALASGLALSVYLAPQVNLRFVGGRRESSTNPSRSFLNSLIGGESDITHRRFETDMDLPDLLASRNDGFQANV